MLSILHFVFFYENFTKISQHDIPIGYLTIIPRTRVGYELLDSGRGAKHRVGYHKLISNKHEWNNCFIKYQTLIKIFRTIFSTDSSFRPFCGKIFCDKNVSFHIWTNCSIKDLYREYRANQITENSISSGISSSSSGGPGSRDSFHLLCRNAVRKACIRVSIQSLLLQGSLPFRASERSLPAVECMIAVGPLGAHPPFWYLIIRDNPDQSVHWTLAGIVQI